MCEGGGGGGGGGVRGRELADDSTHLKSKEGSIISERNGALDTEEIAVGHHHPPKMNCL